MSTHTCPNCGAQTTSTICEYCGATIPFIEDTNAPVVRKELKQYVASFKFDRNRALDTCIRYFKGTMLGLFCDNDLTDIVVESFYIPTSQYSKFSKAVAYGYLCDVESLPHIFPKDCLTGAIIKSVPTHDYQYARRRNQNEELRRAENTIAIGKTIDLPSSLKDEFLNIDHVVYLPFWVVNGKYKGYVFSMLIFGGSEKIQVNDCIFSLTDNSGNHIKLNDLWIEANEKRKTQNAQNASVVSNKQGKTHGTSIFYVICTLLGLSVGCVAAYFLGGGMFYFILGLGGAGLGLCLSLAK